MPCPQTLDPHQHPPRNQANGFEVDCDVIYGDTGSVMVNFGVRVYGGGQAGSGCLERPTFILPRLLLIRNPVYSPLRCMCDCVYNAASS